MEVFNNLDKRIISELRDEHDKCFQRKLVTWGIVIGVVLLGLTLMSLLLKWPVTPGIFLGFVCAIFFVVAVVRADRHELRYISRKFGTTPEDDEIFKALGVNEEENGE